MNEQKEPQYKRFLLFSFADYYPSGGLGDLIGEYDTAEESLVGASEKSLSEYAYIFDCEERRIIWSLY